MRNWKTVLTLATIMLFVVGVMAMAASQRVRQISTLDPNTGLSVKDVTTTHKKVYNPAQPDTSAFLKVGADTCPGLTIGSMPYSDTGSTTGAANNYDEVCPYTGSTAPDVVYRYDPTSTVICDISLCTNTAYDTKLYVYENACPDPGNNIACNDDVCSTNNYGAPYVSEVSGVGMSAGSSYYIVVDGYGSSSGWYRLTVDCAAPATGACCHSDGSCTDDVLEPDCDLYFFEGEICDDIVCPGQGNSCFYNGDVDGANGLSSEDSPADGLVSRTADDFTLTPGCGGSPVIVNEIHANSLFTAGWDPVDATVEFYPDSGGSGPSDYPPGMFTPYPLSAAMLTGNSYYGYPEWALIFANVDAEFDENVTYWISVVGQDAPPNSGQMFWLTVQPGWGSQVYFYSPYFGYYTWTPGQTLWGSVYNCSFELFCECSGPPAPGACCDAATGGCTEEFAADCPGDWLGPNTVCDPNPCPQPPGACCLCGTCCLDAMDYDLCVGLGGDAYPTELCADHPECVCSGGPPPDEDEDGD